MKTSKSLFVTFFIVFCYGCTTKKVITATDITKEKIDSAYVEKKDSTSFVQKGVTVTEKLFEIYIEPVDVSKPIIVDGVKYENVFLKIKKSDKSIVDTTKTVISEVVEKEVQLEKETVKKKIDKSVEKKINYFEYFWLPILLLLLVLVYKLRRLLPNPYLIIRYICQTLKNQIK